MIELIQFPWSPFCIVQRRILEFAGVRFKVVNIPSTDRSFVWKLSRERYYQVPLLRDGRTVVFETGEDSQVIAKYLDARFELGLFPSQWRGLQNLVWRHLEGEVEGFGFKLNDIHYRKFVPRREWLAFIRHKERKFGRGCLERWREQEAELLAGLAANLGPYELMLETRPFLLDDRPRFVDFDLFGMLGNFLASGRHRIPPELPRVRQWHAVMKRLKKSKGKPTHD